MKVQWQVTVTFILLIAPLSIAGSGLRESLFVVFLEALAYRANWRSFRRPDSAWSTSWQVCRVDYF